MMRDAIPNAIHGANMSAAEANLALQFRALRIDVEREYRFHPQRKWRFDFAVPAKKLAIEIEGGLYSGGRHTRGAGFEADLEKYAAAQLLGWTVYRCSPSMVKNGGAINTIEKLLEMQ